MLKIIINISPIGYIEIPEDLEHFKVYMDADSFSVDESIYLTNRNSIEKLLRSPQEAGSFLSSYQNKIELCGLEDLELKITKLDKEHPGWGPLQVHEFKNEGIEHTIQFPIWKLYNHGFLDHLQMEKVLTYVQKQILILREAKQQEIQQNANIYDDVNSLVTQYRFLVNALINNGLDCDSVYTTLRVLEDIQYHDGNLDKVGSSLLYLLLNEGAIDNLLSSIEPNKNSELLEMLLKFQKQVKAFVKTNEDVMTQIIERDIQKNADWFQNLYRDYKSMKNGSTVALESNVYGPITNLAGLGVTLFPPDKKLRQHYKQELNKIQQGVEVDPEEMSKSAFGKASDTARKFNRG